jgi:prevent-host-death family protein
MSNEMKEYLMDDVRVTTADFIKNFGQLADKALSDPVTITKNGRDRLVILSVEEYGRLKRRDRQVYLAHELPESILLALRQTEDLSPQAIALNSEVKDWQL